MRITSVCDEAVVVGRLRCRGHPAVVARASSASAARRAISNSGSAAGGLRRRRFGRDGSPAFAACSAADASGGADAAPIGAPWSSSSRRSLITFSGRKCSRCSRRMKRRRSMSAGENLRYPDGVRSGSMSP